jgi:hypothetical protein
MRWYSGKCWPPVAHLVIGSIEENSLGPSAWSPECSEKALVTPEALAELRRDVERLIGMVQEIHARAASKPQIDPKARYSLADAAHYLDTSPSTLKRRAKACKLVILYDGKTPFVSGAEVLRYAREGASRRVKRRAADRKASK